MLHEQSQQTDLVSQGNSVPVLDLLSHRQESLLDVGCVLGRRLEEGDRELICELLQWRQCLVRRGAARTHLRCTVLDDLLGRQVALVAHQKLVDTLACVAVDLLQPLLDVGECICRHKLCK